jgi:hypothetical protein
MTSHNFLVVVIISKRIKRIPFSNNRRQVTCHLLKSSINDVNIGQLASIFFKVLVHCLDVQGNVYVCKTCEVQFFFGAKEKKKKLMSHSQTSKIALKRRMNQLVKKICKNFRALSVDKNNICFYGNVK